MWNQFEESGLVRVLSLQESMVKLLIYFVHPNFYFTGIAVGNAKKLTGSPIGSGAS